MSIGSYEDVKVLEYEQSQIFLNVSKELMRRAVGDVREMLYGTTLLTESDFHWLSRSWTSLAILFVRKIRDHLLPGKMTVI